MTPTKHRSLFVRLALLMATAALAPSPCAVGCAAGTFVGLGIARRAEPALAATHGLPEPAPDDDALAVSTIEIPGVDCAACNIDVRKAIKGAGGVRRLGEGSPKNRITVTYERGAGRPDVYVEALRKAGFTKAHVVE